MAEITINGANQWSPVVKIGTGRNYDVRVRSNSGFSGTIVVQRRRTGETDWYDVEGEVYTGVVDRFGQVATPNWEFRIGSPDGSGSIVAGIWSE